MWAYNSWKAAAAVVLWLLIESESVSYELARSSRSAHCLNDSALFRLKII